MPRCTGVSIMTIPRTGPGASNGRLCLFLSAHHRSRRFAELSSDRPLAGLGRCRRNTFLRGPLGASIATLGLTCAGTFNARAANFTCSWNDATANWTTVADWSNCNGTDPNNVGGNTYDVTISTGDPTLTTAVTIGSVTINSPGAWTLSGSGAAAALTGTLTNSGTVAL